MIERVASIPEPTASAVSLIDIKDHLRIADTGSEVLLSHIGTAATAYVEKWTQRILSPRDAVLRLSSTPPNTQPIALPGGVVNSVTSVTVDGVEVTGLTIVGNAPALVYPAEEWPAPTSENFPVVLSYNVGYATVPAPLASAIKLYAQWLFDGTDTHAAIEANMLPYRIRPI